MQIEELAEHPVTRAKHASPLLGEEAARVKMPRVELTVLRVAGVADAKSRSRTFDGDVCRIGSHPSNEVVLDDPTVSRFHCKISRAGDAWQIADCASTNGTRVGGVRVLVAELEGGARVTLGDSELRVEVGGREGESVPAPAHFGALIGAAPAMRRLFALLERVAASDIDVLIHGESGTGKELVATELIQRSARAEKPVVVVDCSAIAGTLVESELFGHVKGSFTGADRDHQGAFEAADGGTVFLDELGELPIELQPKLLRALEAREVRRVGETHARHVDVRVIATTNRDLEREVNRGRFREDLYYRLAKVMVRVPPLRDRIEDVPRLVSGILASLDVRDERRLFSPSVIAELLRHDWPGNVRELKNYVERSVVLDDVPPPSKRPALLDAQPSETAESVPFRVAKEAAITAFERAYLGPLLQRCDGNVSKAARVAQMDRMYLHQLTQKHGFR